MPGLGFICITNTRQILLLFHANHSENTDLALSASECDVHEATGVHETLLSTALGLLGLLLLVDLDTTVRFFSELIGATWRRSWMEKIEAVDGDV